jgi:hypothetical protein
MRGDTSPRAPLSQSAKGNSVRHPYENFFADFPGSRSESARPAAMSITEVGREYGVRRDRVASKAGGNERRSRPWS